MEQFFQDLDSPVARVASLDIPFSVPRVLEQSTVIGDEKIFQNTRAVA